MFLGVDIGGTKCAVMLADESGKIIKKEKFPTASVNETLEKVVNCAKSLGKADSIGISCGGPLDSKRGIIQSPPNLPGWNNIEIKRIIEDALGVPVFLQNDANACALAEWRFGAGRGTDNMVFFTFGTGLGAGLILNGKLYEGANGMAGEAGHIRLSDYGPVGYGKTGSFEGFCSGSGIAQLGALKAREALQMGGNVSYCKSYDELDKITAKSIAHFADKGYDDAKAVYDISAQKLGYGLSIIIDILNPERIVIGSIYERSSHLLKGKMMEVLKRECLAQSFGACEIVPALLGDSIGDYAAIAVAMQGRAKYAE